MCYYEGVMIFELRMFGSILLETLLVFYATTKYWK